MIFVHFDNDDSDSDESDDDDDDESEEQTVIDFISPGSVAADEKSIDTIWFVKILENECVASANEKDDCGNVIPHGAFFLKGRFLEIVVEKSSHRVYKLSKKLTYFYKESVIYPFVNMVETEKGYILKNVDFMDIIQFAEANNYRHL